MKAKRWIFFLVLWAISSIAGSVMLSQHIGSYKYNHPYLITQDDSYTVVVDDNDQQTNVLQLNDQNQIVGKISYAKLENQASHYAYSLFESQGGWYLVDVYSTIGESVAHYDLYYLDFDRQEMVLLYQDFTSMMDEQAEAEGITVYMSSRIDMTIEDDVIYFQVIGSNTLLNYLDLTFRFENGECKLEKQIVSASALQDAVYYGDTGVFLYVTAPGIYTQEQQLSSDYASGLVTSREGYVYVLNQSSSVVQRVLMESADLQINWDWSLNTLSKYGLSLQGVRSLSIIDEENYAAAYYDLNMPRVLVERDGVLQIFESSQDMAPYMVALWCILLSLGLCLIEIGLFWLIRYLWGHGSVVVKILSALIPIMMLVSFTSIWLVADRMEKFHREQDQNTMKKIAEEVNALELHQSIEDFHAYRESNGIPLDPTYIEFLNSINSIALEFAMTPSVWDEATGQELSNQYRCVIYYYGLDRETNTYFSIYADKLYVGLDEIMAPNELELFVNMMERDDAQMFDCYLGSNQKLAVLLFPSRLEDGSINGFYMVMGDRLEGKLKISQLIQHFALYQIALCALLVLLFTPIIYFSLKPLSRLRNKAKLLTQGKMPHFVSSKKGVQDEISDLANTFQQLTEQVGSNMEQLHHLQGLSKAYFSQQILDILGKESVAQLYFDESVTCPLYIAYLSIEGKNFAQMQKLVQKLVELLKPCDGFFASVTWREIVLVSKKNTLFYAAAAIAQENRSLQVAFDHTQVVVKVLGTEPEYRFLIVPENRNRKDSLCAYRDALQCRLLAVEGTFPIDQYELRFRKVGLLDQQGLMECFLDSFANRSRLGQKDLEKGVEEFFRGDIQLARNCFVQALRYQPGDPVALYYVKLIDAQINQMQKEEHL